MRLAEIEPIADCSPFVGKSQEAAVEASAQTRASVVTTNLHKGVVDRCREYPEFPIPHHILDPRTLSIQFVVANDYH